MRMKLMIAVPLMMLGVQAFAQTDACTAHPEKCAAVSQDLKDRCANNAAGCEEFKQKISEDCSKAANGCQNAKNRIQANQAAVQSFNAAHPNAAQQESNVGGRMANREENRTERRQKWKENHGGQSTSGSTTTPQQ